MSIIILIRFDKVRLQRYRVQPDQSALCIRAPSKIPSLTELTLVVFELMIKKLSWCITEDADMMSIGADFFITHLFDCHSEDPYGKAVLLSF